MRFLLGGTLAAVALLAAGLVLALAHGGIGTLGFPAPHALRAALGTLPGPATLLSWGLLVLVALPAMRVAVALLGFWREGDRLYVVISATVLALLLAGVSVGRGL
ncbi:MAG: DUF1634 domain-containing protein [Deltaproteobacteria bacterium]|nr:DUF1634 domain-containing protein [Deltaproteobacteria bacterium]